MRSPFKIPGYLPEKERNHILANRIRFFGYTFGTIMFILLFIYELVVFVP